MENKIPQQNSGEITVQSNDLKVSSASASGGVGFIVLVNPQSGKVHTLTRLSEAVPEGKSIQDIKSFSSSPDIGTWSVDPYALGEASGIGGSKPVRQLLKEGWQAYVIAGHHDLFTSTKPDWYDSEGQAQILAHGLNQRLPAQEITKLMSEHAVANGSQGNPAAAFMRIEDGKSHQMSVINGIAQMEKEESTLHDNDKHLTSAELDQDKECGEKLLQNSHGAADNESNTVLPTGRITPSDSPFGHLSQNNQSTLDRFKKHGIKTYNNHDLSQTKRVLIALSAGVGCAFLNPIFGIAAGVAAYNTTKPEWTRTTNAVLTEQSLNLKNDQNDHYPVTGKRAIKNVWYAAAHPLQTLKDLKSTEINEEDEAVLEKFYQKHEKRLDAQMNT